MAKEKKMETEQGKTLVEVKPKRRARQPDKTPELYPQFVAGIERAKRVRVILRKLADWPADDIAALIAALRERADPPTYLINPQTGSVQPIMPPLMNGPLTVTCATNQQNSDIGQPAE